MRGNGEVELEFHNKSACRQHPVSDSDVWCSAAARSGRRLCYRQAFDPDLAPANSEVQTAKEMKKNVRYFGTRDLVPTKPELPLSQRTRGIVTPLFLDSRGNNAEMNANQPKRAIKTCRSWKTRAD